MMSKRSWIKIHCDKWLNGSINKTGIEERGVWISLLCIAGNSDFGDIGFLCITQNEGMIDAQIARLLGVSVKTWRKYKERFTSADRITIHPNNIIEINNWNQFQSEYTRQKSYRPVVTEVTGRVTPEKEKESKIEKENNIYIVEIVEIIDYLNKTCGTNYRTTGKKTCSVITARLNEKYTVEDFKAVIDKKAGQWLHDQEHVQYLRPETLFGNKFESYLNQQEPQKKGNPE